MALLLACLLPFHYSMPVYISKLIKGNESKEEAHVCSFIKCVLGCSARRIIHVVYGL